jgi:hypothetical protein
VVDPQKREIQFELSLDDGSALEFSASQSTAEQVISALAPMAKALRQHGPQTIAVETVAEYTVQRDVYGGPVILRFVTPQGVPYTFAFPSHAAADIATRLKIESEKSVPMGNA